MVEKACDFQGAGTMNGRNAFADALIESGLLSHSGLRARFFSVSDSPGSLSEKDRANEVLLRHIVMVAELVLLLAEDILFCHFFFGMGVNAGFSVRLCGSDRIVNEAGTCESTILCFFFLKDKRFGSYVNWGWGCGAGLITCQNMCMKMACGLLWGLRGAFHL